MDLVGMDGIGWFLGGVLINLLVKKSLPDQLLTKQTLTKFKKIFAYKNHAQLVHAKNTHTLH